jgi:hypothetical protein
LGITAGTRLDFIPEPGGFKVVVNDARKTKRVVDCIGIAGYQGEVISIAAMDVALFVTKP